jgi:hypothetical protein
MKGRIARNIARAAAGYIGGLLGTVYGIAEKAEEVAMDPKLMLLALATLGLQPSTALAQGTAFTYQGELNNNGATANGSYDFRFRLATDPYGNNYVDGPVLTNGVAVNNGLFLATLDFGSVFTGANYWLEVDVRTNGAGAYTVLSPLQPLTPAPYAVYAEGANAAGLSGTVPVAQLPAAVVTNNETGVVLNGLSVTATNVIAPVTVPPHPQPQGWPLAICPYFSRTTTRGSAPGSSVSGAGAVSARAIRPRAVANTTTSSQSARDQFIAWPFRQHLPAAAAS